MGRGTSATLRCAAQVQCNYTCVYNVFKKDEGIFQVPPLITNAHIVVKIMNILFARSSSS
jgi:hypothetical protein